ncbi:hypothetical protein C8R43DRAFT_1237227 [Mycena crocata]|nr:hypothetical protein C8R43DRAFT_1237227 [Mycena crocata]
MSRQSPPFLPEDNVRFLYDFCPPPLSAHLDYGTLPNRCLTFYDRHLDESLVLRRVVPHHALISSLASIADLELTGLLDLGVPLPDDAAEKGHRLEAARSYEDLIDDTVEVAGSSGVAKFYDQNIAAVCLPIVSMLLIRPISWHSVFMWTDRESGKPPHEYDNPFMQNGYSLSIRHVRRELRVPSGALAQFDAETKEDLLSLAKHNPVLATWQIFSPSPQTDDILRKMGGTLSSGPVSATAGFMPVQSRVVRTPDASTCPVLLPDSPEDGEVRTRSARPSRRSARLQSIPAHKSETRKIINPLPSRKQFPRIRPPSSNTHSTVPNNEVLAEDLLHHGWNQAVAEDSSFIVYTNGNSERIGIRHRETQTLFLSNLIDIPQCDPPYVRVHVGLYIAAFRDAVDRHAQSRRKSATTGDPDKIIPDRGRTSATKRRNTEDEPEEMPGNKKRGKIRHVLRLDIQEAFTEASSRNLLLVKVSYGRYNSTAPSSFIRSEPSPSSVIPPLTAKKQASYTANQYSTITVGSHIATGATGAVHDAVLEVRTKDGEVLTQTVVIKLAFFAEQRQRMQHEFRAYQRLVAANVVGIPAVLGLFEDLEGSANALVMSHCGISTSVSRLDASRNFRISEAEKAAFLKIIDDIHRAGVLHGDIRPANLLLDNEKATIIDFDRAELDPSAPYRTQEYARLRSLLEGHLSDAL